jgi:hypothetical protein
MKELFHFSVITFSRRRELPGDRLSSELYLHDITVDDTFDFFNGLKENSSLKSLDFL